MTRISVESRALTDPRFVRLAQILGLADHDHARAKVEWLWMDCTNRGECTLPRWLVEQRLGPLGFDALVECELGKIDRRQPDRIYISGSEELTGWLKRLKQSSSKGGKTRAQNTSRVAGRFTSEVAGDDTSQVAGSTTSALAPALTLALAPALTDQSYAAPAARVRSRKQLPPDEAKTRGEYTTAVEVFHNHFVAAYGSKPTWGAKQGAQINRLLKAHGLVEYTKRVGILFSSPPSWLKPPFDLGTLEQHFDKLAAPAAQTSFASGRVEPRVDAEAFSDGEVEL